MIDENLPPMPDRRDPKNWQKAKTRDVDVKLTPGDIDHLLSIISTSQNAFLELYAAVTGAAGQDKRMEYAKKAFGTMHESAALMTLLMNKFIARADAGEFDEK